MNALLDILGATVIGGLLVISLLAVLFAVTDTNYILENEHAMQRYASTAAQIIDADLSKIGFGIADTTGIILFADSSRVCALGDVNNDGVLDSIEYVMEQTVNTKGDTIPLMKRIITDIPGNTTRFPNLTFRADYYSGSGSITAVPDDIQVISVTLGAYAPEEYKEHTARTYLQWKRFLSNIK